MQFPTKIQLIQRKHGFQFYVNVPAALAVALDFSKGEIAQWSVIDKKHLLLTRAIDTQSVQQVKKKLLQP